MGMAVDDQQTRVVIIRIRVGSASAMADSGSTGKDSSVANGPEERTSAPTAGRVQQGLSLEVAVIGSRSHLDSPAAASSP
jgi:hypothetical protein